VPVVPFQGDGPPFLHQMQRNETEGTTNQPFEEGIPTLITWSYGGNNVTVEGSWDNWTSRLAHVTSNTH
jgi:5'-AMP-activated protein kinase, regulatory beta subunit